MFNFGVDHTKTMASHEVKNQVLLGQTGPVGIHQHACGVIFYAFSNTGSAWTE